MNDVGLTGQSVRRFHFKLSLIIARITRVTVITEALLKSNFSFSVNQQQQPDSLLKEILTHSRRVGPVTPRLALRSNLDTPWKEDIVGCDTGHG